MDDKRTTRILFVDDEPRILAGLRRTLRPMRREWDMSFVESAQEALDFLSAQPCDVIVSDMRMPGMGGMDLLRRVRKLHPHIVRIALSGQADEEAILRSADAVHQFLAKPCAAEMVKSTVTRACTLRELVEGEKLRRLITKMESLPSLPALYHELIDEIQSPDASLKRVGQIVAQDMGMSAKILQLVNSAFFGIQQHVTSPTQAVNLLGLDIIKALVLSVHVFSQFEQDAVGGQSLGALWRHSVVVGAFARQIARAEGSDRKSVDAAFVAGMLHDVGKLVLAVNLPTTYQAVGALVELEGTSLFEAERKQLGANHAQVGAYLLGLWGLPHPVVEATAFHHEPNSQAADHFTGTTAVHVANGLDHERHASDEVGVPPAFDLSHLARLGLTERLLVWRPLCMEVIEGELE